MNKGHKASQDVVFRDISGINQFLVTEGGNGIYMLQRINDTRSE